MSSALVKALEEVQSLNPSSARFGGMEELRRALLAMAQEYGGRLNTLETGPRYVSVGPQGTRPATVALPLACMPEPTMPREVAETAVREALRQRDEARTAANERDAAAGRLLGDNNRLEHALAEAKEEARREHDRAEAAGAELVAAQRELERLKRALDANRAAYEDRQKQLEKANDEANRFAEAIEKVRTVVNEKGL